LSARQRQLLQDYADDVDGVTKPKPATSDKAKETETKNGKKEPLSADNGEVYFMNSSSPSLGARLREGLKGFLKGLGF
jgi:hypothetical protein